MVRKNKLNIYTIVTILVVCILAVYIYNNKEDLKLRINSVEPLFYIQYSDLKENYPVKMTQLPIYVFYHICTANMKILDEQIGELVNSGLYSVATKLFYGCNCSSCDTILEEYMKQYERFEPIPSAILPDTKTYENGTLNAMIAYAKGSKEKFYALYIHTKGTTNISEAQQAWRRVMMYWLVTNYRLCIDILNRDFYTVGLFYSTAFDLHGKQYEGNFFWTVSDYVKTLPMIKKVENRFNAEKLIFSKYQKGKHITLLKELGKFALGYVVSIKIRPTENPYLAIV